MKNEEGGRKAIPFHPPFVAAFPVLSLYSANLALIPLGELWRPLAVAVAAALVTWAVLSLVLRSVERGAIAASILVATFFAYSKISSAIHIDQLVAHPFVAWALLAVPVAGLLTWKFRGTRLFNMLAGFSVCIALVQIAYGRSRESQFTPPERPETGVKSSRNPERPDIFYIILDGYGRQDQLKRVMNYSNEPFISGLRERGFYVADDSHSNYCQTEISLASSLNLDFVQRLCPNVNKDSNDRSPLDSLIDENAITARLQKWGYQSVAITTGFPPIHFSKASKVIQAHAGTTLMETALLQETPVGGVDEAIDTMYVQRRNGLNDAFKNLESLTGHGLKPRFVIAHILAPHPPFVLGAANQVGRPKGPFGFWDGSDYMEHVGTKADYIRGYTTQVEALNGMVLKTLDKLLAQPGPRPIIIVQGDHGSKVGLNQNSLAKTDLKECFSNLNAYLVPKDVESKLYKSITPVNSFRTLLREHFGENLPPLPDVSWYSTFPLPFEFTEVTKSLEAGATPTH